MRSCTMPGFEKMENGGHMYSFDVSVLGEGLLFFRCKTRLKIVFIFSSVNIYSTFFLRSNERRIDDPIKHVKFRFLLT